MALSVEAGLSHACNTENMKKQILCLKRQMKIIERLAVFQEERAPAATALLSSSAHLYPCPLSIFLYVCPLPDPYFHSPFSPHHLSLLTLSLVHLLRCLFQPISLRWIPQLWVFHSRQLIHSLLLRLSWCSRRKAFWGTSRSDPAVLMANLLNRFVWCAVAVASIKTCFKLDCFQGKNKKKSHHLTVIFLQKSQKWWDPDFVNSHDPKAMKQQVLSDKREVSTVEGLFVVIPFLNFFLKWLNDFS